MKDLDPIFRPTHGEVFIGGEKDERLSGIWSAQLRAMRDHDMQRYEGLENHPLTKLPPGERNRRFNLVIQDPVFKSIQQELIVLETSGLELPASSLDEVMFRFYGRLAEYVETPNPEKLLRDAQRNESQGGNKAK